MDAFSYLSVPISIILGLAITELLLRTGRLIQCRKRVTFFWPPLVWTALLLVTAIQSWWALFGLRTVETWNFPSFLVVLLHPIAFALTAALVLPDREEFSHERVDLRVHYFAQARWFFLAVMVTIVASLIRPIVLFGSFSLNLDVEIQAFLFVLAALATLIRSPWYHKWLAIAFATTICAYIGLLFMRL